MTCSFHFCIFLRLLILSCTDNHSTGLLRKLLGVRSLLAFVEIFDDRSEVVQVLTNHSKLLNGKLLSIVVVVEVIRLDLLELLFLVRLLHIYGIVVETGDVLGSVDYLAGL